MKSNWISFAKLCWSWIALYAQLSTFEYKQAKLCLVCSSGKRLLLLTCILNSPTRHRRPGAWPLCCAALLSLKSFPLSGVAVYHRCSAHLLSANWPPSVTAVTAPSLVKRWAALPRFELRLCGAVIRLLSLGHDAEGRRSMRAACSYNAEQAKAHVMQHVLIFATSSPNYTKKGPAAPLRCFRFVHVRSRIEAFFSAFHSA